MKKEMKKSIYDKLVKKDLHYENTNLLVMSSYLDPFCFSELYVINSLRKINIFENNKIKTIPYDLYNASILEFYLVYEGVDGNYSCDSMISGGGDIWTNINLVYSINSIITNGESRNYLSAFAENFMIKFASRIQAKLRNGDLIPDPDLDLKELLDIYSSEEERENKFILKFSSLFPLIPESESVTKSSYKKYISHVENINKFLKENYFNKIEGDGVLGELVNDLGFD